MSTRRLIGCFFGVLLLALPFDGCSGSSDSSAGTTCAVDACGGPPPAHCLDGSTPTLDCVRTQNGTCGWQIGCPQVDAARSDAADSSTTDTSASDTSTSDTSTSDAPGESR